VPLKKTLSQFARFLAVGVLNTAFGYAVFAALVLAGMPPMPALALTYVVGVVFNFATTGRYVFGGAPREAFLRFVAAYVVIYVFNVGLYQVFAWMGAQPLLAQALCVPVTAVFSFAVFRMGVFVGPH
jgi:putative flippase GtrA